MKQTAEILVVEDNLADQVLFRECASLSTRPLSLHFMNDGVEALRFLRGEGEFKNRPRPHLVLLDLNLPKKDGRSVLSEMKKDPKLRDIPVVVMSTSASPEDSSRSYELGASRYIVKPNDLQEYSKLVEELVEQCFKQGN